LAKTDRGRSEIRRSLLKHPRVSINRPGNQIRVNWMRLKLPDIALAMVATVPRLGQAGTPRPTEVAGGRGPPDTFQEISLAHHDPSSFPSVKKTARSECAPVSGPLPVSYIVFLSPEARAAFSIVTAKAQCRQPCCRSICRWRLRGVPPDDYFAVAVDQRAPGIAVEGHLGVEWMRLSLSAVFLLRSDRRIPA